MFSRVDQDIIFACIYNCLVNSGIWLARMRREDIFYISDKRDYVLNGLTSNVYIVKYMNKETEKNLVKITTVRKSRKQIKQNKETSELN